MIETPTRYISRQRGMDSQTNPTRLPESVYNLLNGVFPSSGSIERVPGKTKHTKFDESCVNLIQFGNDVFVAQLQTEIHIVDL